MNQTKKNEVLDTMAQIANQVDAHLDANYQERGNITYYSDFKFKGSGHGVENVYTVETPVRKERETGDNQEINATIYEIYDESRNLIATVTEDGKIHFTAEYLEELREINPEYFEQLNLDDLDFELPEELKENDIVMTKEELREHERKQLDRDKEGRTQEEGNRQKDNENKDKQEKEEKQATEEEEKREQVAEALGIDSSEIKSICTINPREKITDKHNLVDMMPEAEGYDEIMIAYGSANEKSHGQFTMLGVKKDEKTQNTTYTPLTSIEPVEGTSSGKDVISVNKDGTEVTEKQVKGLFRINSRGRNDGISVSIGNYGMMDVDYVSNVMDKEHRRATPIRTKGPENVRTANAEVRENAGDSIEEVKREGRIFRAKEKDGIDPQSLDGIDIDRADGGEMTLEELKAHITEKTLEQGVSQTERREFIESEITQSGLELSEDEIEHTTNEIETRVIDESRFETRGSR